MEIQTARIMTGFSCKDCDGNITGHYCLIEDEMFVKCECKCSFWLVKSSYLLETFNFSRRV